MNFGLTLAYVLVASFLLLLILLIVLLGGIILAIFKKRIEESYNYLRNLIYGAFGGLIVIVFINIQNEPTYPTFSFWSTRILSTTLLVLIFVLIGFLYLYFLRKMYEWVKNGNKIIPSEEKKRLLIDHFCYEANEIIKTWKKLIKRSSNKKYINENRSIKISDESRAAFLLHIRNLYEFFNKDRRNPDSALVIDYFPNWQKDKNKEINKQIIHVHKFLSHLTYSRVDPNIENSINDRKLFEYIIKLIERFVNDIEKEKRYKEFITKKFKKLKRNIYKI